MSSNKRTQEEAEVLPHQAKRIADDEDEAFEVVDMGTCSLCQDECDKDDLFRCKDQDGKLWLVCPECNKCVFCRDGLGEVDAAADEEENTYIVSGVAGEERVLACGGNPGDDPLERGGCGAVCHECGLVEARKLVFTQLNCGRNLCVKHIGHECIKCDKDVTDFIEIEGRVVDKSQFCTPYRTFGEQSWRVRLADVEGYSDDTDDRVFVMLNDLGDNIISVSGAVYARLFVAEEHWRKANFAKK